MNPHYAFAPLLVAVACSSSDPAPCRITADPECSIHVDVTGDDAANGIAAPIKTLKHAIELATANPAHKTILLAAGSYDAANGETYPYAVPAEVRVSGTAGTILAGTAAEPGLVVDSGTLENLEFDHFTTAVEITGRATLATITVSASEIAVLTTGAATLTATGVAISGNAACSTIGLQAQGTSRVTVEALVATDTVAIDERDHAIVSVAKSRIAGTSNCILVKASGQSLSLTDTSVSGKRNTAQAPALVPPPPNGMGLRLDGATSRLDVALLNTIITGTSERGISGYARVFQMTGGAIRDNDGSGAVFTGGMYTLTDVDVSGNPGTGVYINSDAEPGVLAMRHCAVNRNGNGVQVALGARGDLGTISQPGNNNFADNAGIGLTLYDDSSVVTAAGNVWRPAVQGADGDGKYTHQSIMGSVLEAQGNNFAIPGNSTLQF